MNRWVETELRDRIVSFVEKYTNRTELPASRLISWIGLSPSRFYQWQKRRGEPNNHNAPVPKKHWLEEWECQAICKYYLDHKEDGYRRVAYMIIDADIAAASPSSVYRVLKKADLLFSKDSKESKKGTGFHQPSKPHKHWHTDVSYINIAGTFYYFCGVIDGFSRFLIHWEIRPSMLERDIEIILQRAHEKYPSATPRIISDNGPQFIAKEFKEFVKTKGMTHVRTSPYYPQSNGKIERFHKSLKHECIRPRTPVSLADAQGVVDRYIDYYNTTRLHSAIGYITPADMLGGRAEAVRNERRRKLKAAQEKRQAPTQNTLTGSERREALTPSPT